MLPIMIFILGLLSTLVLYGILIYNNLVFLKNNVFKNWANIDVLLKQRNSELPKLIDTCQEYMKFEQETLQKVVIARQAAISASQNLDITALNLAEKDLHTSLGKLFALAENYPELKTNHSFIQLQARITDLENSIADRREFYNESVNINNIRIAQVPDNIIATLFHFKSYELLEFKNIEKEDIHVGGLFKKDK